MPEGHTIHRHAILQNRLLAGRRVTSTSPQGRFTGADIVSRCNLRRVEPLGKHLFYHFRCGLVHVHLGMHGRYRTLRHRNSPHLRHRPELRDQMTFGEDGWPEPTPAVRWRLLAPGSGVGVDLTGPTACDLIDPDAAQAIRDRLGPDLLAPDAMDHLPAVRERCLASRAPLSVLLMDQSVISGIGNAYRAELLYRARIHPLTPGRDVEPERFDALYRDAVTLLHVGVRHRHILCIEPHHFGKARWRDLAPDERFWVYRRETCRGCDTPTTEITQAGRSVFYCPEEQR